MLRAALLRGLGLVGFWLLLSAPTASESAAGLTGDLAVGVLAGCFATWVSLQLLPPPQRSHRRRPRLLALLRLFARFVWQSVVAGLDVAGRVFDPRLPLRPGFVAFPVRIPPGPCRAAFGALTSVVPGTLSVRTNAAGAMIYHCLDDRRPVVAGLAKDEALLLQSCGEEIIDG